MIVRTTARHILPLTLMMPLMACGAAAARPSGPTAASADWRGMATPEDRVRLRTWREAWLEGIRRARAGGGAADITREGDLFNPDRALAGAVPPAGRYRCRVFKLGAKGTAMAEFTAYPDFECQVDDEGEVSSFYKLSGSQRPVGLLFHDSDTRSVFLGTLVLGDERRQMEYGRDAARDMAGFVERVAAKRWRLVLPYPRYESIIDVIELVPVAG